MGGTKDIWRKSKGNIGLEIENLKTKGDDHHPPMLGPILEQSEQQFNDQKLEFFTWSSGIKVGFEKIITGQADKIYQGPGPIIITFKPTPEKNSLDKYNRVYLNIDGEYYHVVKPTQLRVKLNKKLCNGSIHFMQKKLN